MQQWRAKYTKILILHHKAIPVTEIAKTVGMSVSGLHKVIEGEEFKNRLNKLHQADLKEALKDSREEISEITKARDIICKNALKAAITIAKLSKRAKPTDRIRFEAAKDILDRAGLKPEEKLEIRERTFSPEELEGMRTTLGEIESMTMRLSDTGSRFLLTSTPRSSDTDKGSNDTTSDGDNPQPLPEPIQSSVDEQSKAI